MHRGNYINGEFRESATQGTVLNPATGSVAGHVPLAGATEALEAVEAAAAAQRAWARLPAIERGNALRRFAAEIEARADAIGAALALESGKSPADARGEAIYGAELMRYHAEWARRIEGEIIPSDNPGETLLLRREAIGVVACLIPFNYPVYTLVRKIARALIAGGTPWWHARAIPPRSRPLSSRARPMRRGCRPARSISSPCRMRWPNASAATAPWG